MVIYKRDVESFSSEIYCQRINQKTNYKTEYCRNFLKGVTCKFGDGCTYAHGKHELRQYKAQDLKSMGVTKNLESFRLYPCLTWVATGSCPFEGRCQCVHDPRAKGAVKHWLQHIMTPKVIPSFHAQADDIYHLQMSSIFRNSPFGSLLASHEADNWIKLYESVCNLPVRYENRIPHKNKVEIALRMHYHAEKENYYTFSPKHEICGKPCMILQTRAFLLDEGNVREITIQQYFSLYSERERKLTVLAFEIAFGPLSDKGRLGIWFDIPAKNILPYSSKTKYGDVMKDQSYIKLNCSSETPFYIAQTLDNDAYQLIRDVLQFYVINENSKNDTKNNSSNKAVYTSLKHRFESIMLNYATWSWPSNANGYGASDVAEVDVLYDFDSDQSNLKAQKIWGSFVKSMNNKSIEKEKFLDDRFNNFKTLEQENPPICIKAIDNLKINAPCKENDSCWQSLLLESSGNNEWEVLKRHYSSA